MKRVSKSSVITKMLNQGMRPREIVKQIGAKPNYVYTISSRLNKQKKLTDVNKPNPATIKATTTKVANTQRIQDLTEQVNYLHRVYADARAVIQYLEAKITQLAYK